uniref:Uncharacterized protein n=1 Tax=Mimiviridae sp. ChoanoV1 TaxID=2596887 RepID=A0A5B8IJB4_9VIRU|nr:hypothetical protein 9_3 [Mimiviridae sp. ChoanoV1]
MDNHRLLYDPIISESDSESSDDENQVNSQIFLPKEQKYKYELNKFQFMVNTIDRDLDNLNDNDSVFDFQIKFNTSGNSFEETKTGFDSENKPIYEKQEFYGSKLLSLPITIKNVKSIYLERLLIPNKKVFISEGQYIHILDLPYISIEIEEFSNIVLGTNDNLNKSFANMITTSTNYKYNTSQKFLELKNLTDNPKVFKPSPLNSLNSLTLKIKDNLGNILDYRNQYLILNEIGFNDNNLFMKIITKNEFSNLDYSKGDIVIFKNLDIDNFKLKNFLERTQGHKIYFTSNFEEPENLNTPNSLVDIFYINNYNLGFEGVNDNSYKIIYNESDELSDITAGPNKSNIIVNINQQLTFSFKVENIIKTFDNLNIDII